MLDGAQWAIHMPLKCSAWYQLYNPITVTLGRSCRICLPVVLACMRLRMARRAESPAEPCRDPLLQHSISEPARSATLHLLFHPKLQSGRHVLDCSMATSVSTCSHARVQHHRGNSQTHLANAPTAEKTATAPLCKGLRGMCVIGAEGVLP